MRWLAEHRDGFKYRDLSYTLRVDGGQAELNARWGLLAPIPELYEYRGQFALDDGPVARALPALRGMAERCGLEGDDSDSDRLVIEADGERITRTVKGCVLPPVDPGVEAFRALFEWVEEQVLAHLPPAIAPVWGVNVGIEVLGRLCHAPAADPPEQAGSAEPSTEDGTMGVMPRPGDDEG